MADTSHRTRWLLNAEDACGVDQTAAQITWLRAKRAEYAALVDSGDWETQSASGEAGSSSSKRGVSDRDQHDAIVAALRHLGATDIGRRPGIIIPQFGGALN